MATLDFRLCRTRTSWRPQAKRGSVTACRFMLQYSGRWYRLYSDHAVIPHPHFIRVQGARLYVENVSP